MPRKVLKKKEDICLSTPFVASIQEEFGPNLTSKVASLPEKFVDSSYTSPPVVDEEVTNNE